MAVVIDLKDTAISITVNLSGIPANEAGFGTVLYASPSVTPVGANLIDTYTYATHTTALAAAVTAGALTQDVADDITAAFAQSPHPTTIKAGELPVLASPSTLAVDLAALAAEDNDWYGLVIDLDTCATAAIKSANIVAAAAWVESQMKVCVCQTDDVDVYNPALDTDPFSLEQALAHEHTAGIWSQLIGGPPGTTEQPSDLCAICRWLAFDPDLISAPFRAQVGGQIRCRISATGIDLSAAEIAAVKAKNGNVLQLYGSAAAFLDEGINFAGRAFEEVLSGHWLESRIRSDIATQAVAVANRGEKWPLNEVGAAYLAAIVNRRLQQGVNANHFESFTPGSYTINTTTKTITYAARALYLDNAIAFSVTVNFD
uniref:Tail sheath protein n=2 Tax=viral metagenome TaxID=1070528 RepID=A0A6M3J9T5_9ZZZZ